MSTKDGHIEIVFDCPIHGEETQVYCWRAFSDEFAHRWFRFYVERKRLQWNPGELAEFIDAKRKQADATSIHR